MRKYLRNALPYFTQPSCPLCEWVIKKVAGICVTWENLSLFLVDLTSFFFLNWNNNNVMKFFNLNGSFYNKKLIWWNSLPLINSTNLYASGMAHSGNSKIKQSLKKLSISEKVNSNNFFGNPVNKALHLILVHPWPIHRNWHKLLFYSFWTDKEMLA